MKVKTMLLAGCLFSLGACDESQFNLNQLTPERYHKILYLGNSGKQDLILYDTEDDFIYTLTVLKVGSNPDLTADIDVNVLTQEEIDSRYSEPGVIYKRISEDCYSLEATHLDFSSSDRFKKMDVTLDPQKVKVAIESNPTVVWVLPLQISSVTDSINMEKSVAFLKIKDVIMPSFGFRNTTMNMQSHNYGSVTTLSENIILGLDAKNKWEIGCQLEIDEEYVTTYNKKNNTVFQLLPQDTYTMEKSMTLSSGITEAELAVSIKGDQLEPNDYLLPIRIKSVTMFEVSSTDALYPLAIRVLGPQLNRTGWTAEANTEELVGEGTNGSIGCILDSNIESFWHSQWKDGNVPLPHKLIIDTKKEYTFTQFAMVHRSGYTDVRTGTFHISTDKKDWTEVGRFTMRKEQGTQIFGITPMKGRYFKIIINESYRESNSALAEVYAYGIED